MLNRLLAEAFENKKSCACLSIGYDGEKTDALTKMGKPVVLLHPNQSAFTTWADHYEQKLLRVCEKTGIQTAFGEIVLARAEKETKVELISPGGSYQIKKLLKLLNVDICLIDGSFNRKYSISPQICDGYFLSVGAAYSEDINKTLDWFQFFIDLQNLPVITDKDSKAINFASLTDETALQLIHTNPFNKRIVLKDNGGIFISPQTFRLLTRKGFSINYQTKSKLLGVTVNPFSPYNYSYDKSEFIERAREIAGEIPVINVLDNTGGL